MSGLFGGGSTPKPPPPPPTVDDARGEMEAKDAARRRRGMAATVLSGKQGVGSSPTGTKTLLGS